MDGSVTTNVIYFQIKLSLWFKLNDAINLAELIALIDEGKGSTGKAVIEAFIQDSSITAAGQLKSLCATSQSENLCSSQ